MDYKLVNENTVTGSIIETILLNRGIKNPKEYLNLKPHHTNDYRNLDNIDEAVECFNKHFERGDDIAILVDCDP